MVRPAYGNSLTYVPNAYNTSHGNPLPDSLLMSMELPVQSNKDIVLGIDRQALKANGETVKVLNSTF